MNRLYSLLRRLAGIEDPPATRLTREEAIELARAAATEGIGPGWDEPMGAEAIGAGAMREGNTRRIVWTVMTNASARGGHVRVKIDDATGEVVELRVLPM